MKKSAQVFLLLFISTVLICLSTVTSYAEVINGSTTSTFNSEISPRLSNCDTATLVFQVIDNEAVFSVSYIGRSETFVMARLKVQVQKKVLGLFWTDVGEQWVGDCYDVIGHFYGTIPANGTGTYRANFILHIVGNTGIVDEITDTINCKYS